MTRYAEVIGDPVSHSLSPTIHRDWLRELGIDARYEATRVTPETLPAFLADRRRDPDWAGCNITAPLKQAVLPHIDRVDDQARQTGAVNCVYPEAGGLAGTNTDVDGLAAALDHLPLHCARVAMIGAGGAARAMLTYLRGRGVGETVLLVRDPEAVALAGEDVRAMPITAPDFSGARLIANATPLGLAGGTAMPPAVLAALPGSGAAVMDMVYSPLETPLLAASRANGLEAIDGLAMLIGQARRAFRLFFGVAAPGTVPPLRV